MPGGLGEGPDSLTPKWVTCTRSSGIADTFPRWNGSSGLELARKAHREGQDGTVGGGDRATQSAGASEGAYGSEIETRVALFPPVARLIEALAWPLEVPSETSETAVNWTTVKIV
jgi:hypothetical protein